MDVLLVDGYNIIGAWPELRKLKNKDFAEARDRLIERMAEYQAFTGIRVIIVFDAYLVRGVESVEYRHGIEVIYTSENQIADKKIEKLAIDLRNIKTQIYVATNDYTEQWQIFGQGALRISARELLNQINKMEQSIKREIDHQNRKKFSKKIDFSDEIGKIFEKWRRGDL